MCNWSETGDVHRSDAPVSQSESGGDSDDAIEHGGSTIEIAGEETASGYRLAVSDDGPGIPTHQQDEAFGLFDKGDDSDGTGIALAVCEQTVNRHNGDIRVESTGSRGRRFILRSRPSERRRNETLYTICPVEGSEGSWVSLAILRALGARDPGSNPGEPIFTLDTVR